MPSTENSQGQIGPVTVKERLEILDVLRGFALFGVLIANVVWFFSGFGDLDASTRENLPTAAIDSIVLDVETFLVVNKFISIFTFLFGVGFAIQMQRASEQSGSVLSRYVRRLLWLLLFGSIHAIFIWYGDILHLYAILGLFLILWRSRSDKELIIWGLLFAVFFPIAIRALIWGLPMITKGAVDPTIGFDARWDYATTLHGAFADGAYGEIVRANLADVWAWLSTDDALTTGIASFGKFLLGYWAGRTGLLSLAVSHEQKWGGAAIALVYKGAKWGLAIGLVFQGLLQADNLIPGLGADVWAARVTRSILWQIGVLALATSYICGIVLLFRHSAWRRYLMLFAPVGRMALTNYVGQSVICIILFYGIGFGIYGKVGPTLSIVIATIVFVLQAMISSWWLARFSFGPAEWAWRSLTYGRLQHFRLSP